jgi:hypothetical protein
MTQALTLKDSPQQVAVDSLQAMMLQFPPVDCPVEHVFTPGLYTRQCLLPAGTVLISKIHRTEHPYAVLTGRARVWTEGEGVVEVRAPAFGITKPGTRRVIWSLEDTVWVTFHPTELTDLVAIEEFLIEPRELPQQLLEQARLALLGGDE